MHDPETWKTARRLVAHHGKAALPLAANELRKRLQAGQCLSFLAWTQVALAVAVILDPGRGMRLPPSGGDELGRVIEQVTRRLREAGH